MNSETGILVNPNNIDGYAAAILELDSEREGLAKKSIAARLRVQLHGDHSEAAGDALSVVIGFTGVVLAFPLVQAQGSLRNLENQVGIEAHNLAQMDRLLLRYGETGNGAIRAALRDYANSIVRDEWPELGKGASSERTAALFTPISRSIFAIEPTPGRQSLIYVEMLRKADELAAAREARAVAASDLKLPSIFWQTIISLLVSTAPARGVL